MLPIALGCTKASILFFYLRIFTATKRSRTYSLFVISIVIIIAMMIGFFFSTLFECRSHISAMWQSAVALETYCPNSDSYDYGFSISDFITDIFILAVPIPLVSVLASHLFLVSFETDEQSYRDLANEYGSKHQISPYCDLRCRSWVSPPFIFTILGKRLREL
jgi:hypothetical protein